MRERAEGRISGGAHWRWTSVANRARIAAKDIAAMRDRRRTAIAGPTVAQRQAELVEFYTRFERFVEMLCDAAQYGPNSRLEAAYAEDRAWVSARYRPLKPFVGAYLSPEESDAFERLFGAEDLQRFLADDDGAVIYRITSTRDALSLYAEHLRQLAARKGA